jgi:hypothetical protein
MDKLRCPSKQRMISLKKKTTGKEIFSWWSGYWIGWYKPSRLDCPLVGLDQCWVHFTFLTTPSSHTSLQCVVSCSYTKFFFIFFINFVFYCIALKVKMSNAKKEKEKRNISQNQLFKFWTWVPWTQTEMFMTSSKSQINFLSSVYVKNDYQ